MGLGPFGKWKRYFLSDQTRWSSRPDARVTSGRFIPRAEVGRAPARSVGHGISASGQAPREATRWAGLIRHCDAFGQSRSDTSSHEKSSLVALCTRPDATLWRVRPGFSVARASGDRTLGHVRSNQAARPVTSKHVRLRSSDRYDRSNEI
jgi:hypothetical protein